MKAKKNDWMQKLSDNMFDDFAKRHNEEHCVRSVITDYHFNDGSFIEVELTSNDEVNVWFYHKDANVDRNCENIEQFIVDNLPHWDDYKQEYEESFIEDEWQAHGFKDEADYVRYKFG